MSNRTFSMGMRQPLRKLTDDEITFIKKEIKRISADESVFVMDTERMRKTLYDEVSDKVYVGSNVFPDNENPDNMTDKLSVACVLGHEYYGHRSMREEYLKEEVDSSMTAIDEFKASFKAYQNTPNLTEDERNSLFMHAYEIAKTNMLDKEIKICREIMENLYTKSNDEVEQKEQSKGYSR